jgi:hypothetical protein
MGRITRFKSKPEKDFSKYGLQAKLSYLRKKEKSSECTGFFGRQCPNKILKAGFCGTCYQKKIHLKGVNLFLFEFIGINNMDVSTSNILNYSKSVCVTCPVNYCTLLIVNRVYLTDLEWQ